MIWLICILLWLSSALCGYRWQSLFGIFFGGASLSLSRLIQEMYFSFLKLNPYLVFLDLYEKCISRIIDLSFISGNPNWQFNTYNFLTKRARLQPHCLPVKLIVLSLQWSDEEERGKLGIFHDIMSCWTTLAGWPCALFRGPRGPQNGPKEHQNGLLWHKMAFHDPKWPFNDEPSWPKMSLHDPKCLFMTQNVPGCPQMALKHFSGT